MAPIDSPVDLVEIISGGQYPADEAWAEGRRLVKLGGACVLDRMRKGLEGGREQRWATAVVLLNLGPQDGDELALVVLSEIDWSLIPGPAFICWQTASWHVRDAIQQERRPEVQQVRPDVLNIATRALERADLGAPEWTDVVDEALGLLDWIELDARAVEVIKRVAVDHWNQGGRNHAAAILEDHQRLA